MGLVAHKIDSAASSSYDDGISPLKLFCDPGISGPWRVCHEQQTGLCG